MSWSGGTASVMPACIMKMWRGSDSERPARTSRHLDFSRSWLICRSNRTPETSISATRRRSRISTFAAPFTVSMSPRNLSVVPKNRGPSRPNTRISAPRLESMFSSSRDRTRRERTCDLSRFCCKIGRLILNKNVMMVIQSPTKTAKARLTTTVSPATRMIAMQSA